MNDIPIPITAVRLGDDEERLVLEVLRSGMLAQGPKVAWFEELFASICGTKHAIAVNNGTSALVAALQAHGVGPGDEVVTSPFTFVATVNAALEVGATVRLADIDSEDFTLDVQAAAEVVTERTRAILPVHLFGQGADMAGFVELAARSGAALVEDAAQAHGANVDGRPVGGFGTGCFSFYATKNVTTGEGGVITTDSDELADRLRVLRNQGMRARYEYEIAGHNYRMTDLQAAIGIPQLERLSETNAMRQRNAAKLTAGLAGIEGLLTPVVRNGRDHVFHQYTVRITDDARLSRSEVIDGLASHGIGSGSYYPRVIQDYECYRNDTRVIADSTPRAEQAASEVLSLPVHPHLSDSDVDRIVHAVHQLLGS